MWSRASKIEKLRCEAAMLEAADQTVTVELSLPAAWLLRDMIGIHGLGNKTGAPLMDDMLRINEAVGHRDLSTEPSVARWSALETAKLFGKDTPR